MSTLPALPKLYRPTDEEIDRAEAEEPFRGTTIEDWCPTCGGDKKFLWYAREDLHRPHRERHIETYECPCADQFRLWRLFYCTGLKGGRYGQLNWGDVVWVPMDSFTFVKDYIDKATRYQRRGIGLFLQGNNGTGKSMLASLVFRHFLGLGHFGYWVTYHDMLTMYTATWNRRQDTQEWFDTAVRNADVLVVDDLGKESQNQTFQEISRSALDGVFRARWMARRPTIFTTNLDPAEIGRRYSGSMLSLMGEACLHRRLSGEDRRPDSRQIDEYEIEQDLTRPFTLR